MKVPRCESCPLRRTGVPVGEQRGEGGELGHAVVEGARAGGHLQALLEELFDLGMDVEAARDTSW